MFARAKVVDSYRSKLRNDLHGSEGDEVARQRIERFVNSVRPSDFVVGELHFSVAVHLRRVLQDPIQILSVDLGNCAPRISNVRLFNYKTPGPHYTDVRPVPLCTILSSLTSSSYRQQNLT